MKKLISSWLVLICLGLLLICAGSSCHAAANFPRIAFSRVAIGGIQPFATKDYVRSVYGEPTKIVDLKNSPLYCEGNPDEHWIYGDSFSIDFAKGYVFCVISSGANGLRTPDEIGVGDSEAKVIAAYGRKWKLGYWYTSDYDTTFSVSVRNGKVTQIYAGWNL